MGKFSGHLLGISLLASLGGCDNAVPGQISRDAGTPSDPPASCTDDATCCPNGALRCTGDPDSTLTCTCQSLWDCSQNPSKCPPGIALPSGASSWRCAWTGSAYQCTPAKPSSDGGATSLGADSGTKPPAPPPDGGVVPPVPLPGQQCVPGQRRWCDGQIYCGWGQQLCNADGTWDPSCGEVAGGLRPKTTCACYHIYFDPKCCETPDCMVPPGTNGQVCPPSDGALCSYCSPSEPECLPGGDCIVTVDNEAYCSTPCGPAAACPSGYKCKAGQCLPKSGSCSGS